MRTYSHSTHLLVYEKAVAELVVVCGNYCRRLRKYLFSGETVLTGWERLPTTYRQDAKLVPYVAPIKESKGEGMLNTCDNF